MSREAIRPIPGSQTLARDFSIWRSAQRLRRASRPRSSIGFSTATATGSRRDPPVTFCSRSLAVAGRVREGEGSARARHRDLTRSLVTVRW
jgi:hypothetical protein